MARRRKRRRSSAWLTHKHVSERSRTHRKRCCSCAWLRSSTKNRECIFLGGHIRGPIGPIRPRGLVLPVPSRSTALRKRCRSCAWLRSSTCRRVARHYSSVLVLCASGAAHYCRGGLARLFFFFLNFATKSFEISLFRIIVYAGKGMIVSFPLSRCVFSPVSVWLIFVRS